MGRGPTEGQVDVSPGLGVHRYWKAVAFKAGSAPSSTLPGSPGESFILFCDHSHTLCTCLVGTYQAFGGGTSLAVPQIPQLHCEEGKIQPYISLVSPGDDLGEV